MRAFFWSIALATCVGQITMFALPEQAIAQKRVALVIGNGAYEKVGKLSNPTRSDARGAPRVRFRSVEVGTSRRIASAERCALADRARC